VPAQHRRASSRRRSPPIGAGRRGIRASPPRPPPAGRRSVVLSDVLQPWRTHALYRSCKSVECTLLLHLVPGRPSARSASVVSAWSRSGHVRCFKPRVDPSSLTGGDAATSLALHSTRRRRVPPGAAQMDCWGLLALCARSLVEHAAWASCRRATSDLKHLAGTCSWLGKAIVSHRGDGAAWPHGPQIDWHRTGMRAATVLIVAAHRAAAGMHARRHQRGQERR